MSGNSEPVVADSFLKTVLDGAGPALIPILLIGILFVFAFIKQVSSRGNSPLRLKYTLLLLVVPLLNLLLTLTFEAQAVSTTSFTTKTGIWSDPSALASDIYYAAQVTIFGHYLTMLYYLIAIITILIQKPLNKESVSNQ